MRVLIVGGGGREHALAWKIEQSPQVDKIFCAPGNAGIAEIAECRDVNAEDIKALLFLARQEGVDLTVVGPEAPLVGGIVDVFVEEGMTIFGPSRRAALLEGSKVMAKEIMQRYGVPTASFKVFDEVEKAVTYIKRSGGPVVVKADGLAAGKGVIVADTVPEAVEALEKIMRHKAFGEAGRRVVIEERLEGEEVSVFAFVDGENYILMPEAQDHKAVFDGDKGPNTGGMGSYSPAPVFTPELKNRIEKEIFNPLLKGLRQEGIIYRGVLYAGLMITREGPKVLEFNVRFGDPETQVLMPRLKSDLAEILLSVAKGSLARTKPQWSEECAVCVVLSSRGYPGAYEKGKVISGLEVLKGEEGIMVFHAGTARDNNNYITSGGRVLGITACRPTLEEAVSKVYQAVEKVQFEGCHYRRDIAYRALNR